MCATVELKKAGKMDPALSSIQQARKTLICSREWEDVNREILFQLQHLQGEGSPRNFSSLSDVEKVRAVGMATTALEKTHAFSKLQSKVSATVDDHFSPIRTQPSLGLVGPAGLDSTAADPPRSDLHMQTVSRACNHLLVEWPYLVHHLKKCFNHPIPPDLRATAWRLLLQHPTVKNDFMVMADPRDGYVATTPEEMRISHRCETLLTSPIYEMANSVAILRAMRNIMLYWSRRSGSMVSDTDLLVCIPFLYVRREELSKQFGEAQGGSLSTVAEIATQYVRFMKMIPLTLHSVVMEQALEAMNEFSLEVERLLSSEDHKLYQDLQKKLGYHAAVARTSAVSHESQLPFHKRLRNIIHPHIQRILVGDVSMEVLCFIWDQCFIGWHTPGYRFLPHVIVVWLILLKDKLKTCRSAKDIEQALVTGSATLTVRSFQKEIEKRFLYKLSSLLRITPIRMKVRNEYHHMRKRTTTRGPSNRRGLEPKTGEGEHAATLREYPEEELLTGRITGLQRQLEEDHQTLNALLKEREDRKKEMATLRREVAVLKTKAAELRVSKSVSQSSSTIAGVTAVPANSTVLSPLSSTGYVMLSPEQRAQMASNPDVPVLIPLTQNTVTPRTQRQDESYRGVASSQPKRPYSPLHLTERDVQDIWLKLLGRFTAAAYTVCHGASEELNTGSTTLQEHERISRTNRH